MKTYVYVTEWTRPIASVGELNSRPWIPFADINCDHQSLGQSQIWLLAAILTTLFKWLIITQKDNPSPLWSCDRKSFTTRMIFRSSFDAKTPMSLQTLFYFCWLFQTTVLHNYCTTRIFSSKPGFTNRSTMYLECNSTRLPTHKCILLLSCRFCIPVEGYLTATKPTSMFPLYWHH